MIPKQEILSTAAAIGLRPDTVEKDYVLSWVLYGLSKNTRFAGWVFKGGTCLKKCYFDTYRFSEDLDFTVSKNALYDKEGIESALTEIAASIYEETGIRLKLEGVKESVNKRESRTFEAKISYIGPLNYNRSGGNPRIKFDITSDEVLAEEPDSRAIFHPYTDAPNPPALIHCYSIHEILAEKTRAMLERAGRARDLYDVIQITRNFREHIQSDRALACLKKKFAFKSLPEPTVQLLMESIDLAILKANWEDQLSHQLPQLIAVESFYNVLPIELAWWIENRYTAESLQAISNAPYENVLPREYFPLIGDEPSRSLGTGRRASMQSVAAHSAGHLYQVRYAARNRLCIQLEYHGVLRIVEPYSLRRPSTGNLLLYAFEQLRGNSHSNQIKAFKVPEIKDIQLTNSIFNPRYLIEL
ncbi:MAG TPA: nucleotidyl transferase AbiEii/AbiGii toxin family protein [Puia sp.]|nr:nucleotidyl transferase AbiEii/AbiGii toxin family protein [Puia sp.]